MATKAEKIGDVLKLELDGGDNKKFYEAMDKWNFKDEQCLLRFAISVLLLTEDKQVGILESGVMHGIAPQKFLLK